MQDDEEQIRKLVSTWMEATKNGDLDSVLGLMAEDVVFLIAGQPPMAGRAAYAEAARSFASETPPEIDGHSNIREICVLGDWAWMWTELTVDVTPRNGEQMRRAGHTLTVLKKEHGRWVIARDANMLAPVPTSSER